VNRIVSRRLWALPPARRLLTSLPHLLRRVPQRERYILRMRYGLDDLGVEKSAAEVSLALGVPERTIRQYEARGIRKLRHPQRATYLAEFSAAGEAERTASDGAAKDVMWV
jgi:DNA-directed RNA polymerase sigma subunit (sigma70/sigma32)